MSNYRSHHQNNNRNFEQQLKLNLLSENFDKTKGNCNNNLQATKTNLPAAEMLTTKIITNKNVDSNYENITNVEASSFTQNKPKLSPQNWRRVNNNHQLTESVHNDEICSVSSKFVKPLKSNNNVSLNKFHCGLEVLQPLTLSRYVTNSVSSYRKPLYYSHSLSTNPSLSLSSKEYIKPQRPGSLRTFENTTNNSTTTNNNSLTTTEYLVPLQKYHVEFPSLKEETESINLLLSAKIPSPCEDDDANDITEIKVVFEDPLKGIDKIPDFSNAEAFSNTNTSRIQFSEIVAGTQHGRLTTPKSISASSSLSDHEKLALNIPINSSQILNKESVKRSYAQTLKTHQ